MNRSDLVPLQNRAHIPATCKATGAILYGAVIDAGREITRLTIIAERQGDSKAVEMLLREKDRIHRVRRELSNVIR